jgi:Phage Tail Collar Domain
MPATTPCVQIPYPVSGDPPDVAGDFARLAARLDALICAIGGNPIGSFTPWWDNGGATPQGYLRCVGGTFDSGTYPDLAAHLGTTTLPDLRGKFLRGTGGNFPGNGQMSGWDDAVVAPHTHGVGDHQHSIAHVHNLQHVHDISHTHNGGTYGANARHVHYSGGGHSEVVFRDGAYNTGYAVPRIDGAGYGAGGLAVTWGGLAGDTPDHAHGFSVGFNGGSNWANVNYTGGAEGGLSGFAGAQTTTGPAGTAVAGTHLNRNLPPFMNITYLIRATADVV